MNRLVPGDRPVGSPLGVVRRFPLSSFVLLACLFGWSPYVVAFVTGGSGAENNPLGPLVATLVVVSCQGREQRMGSAAADLDPAR